MLKSILTHIYYLIIGSLMGFVPFYLLFLAGIAK
jgi:hypothetical protein